ncbi:galactoside O-acetyltransferase [Hymenobacter qilianensis]|uniref:Galactoside O-acetyltransferase n=2 Tax=Hymenobacter qilianensis TaxID=1385715 RepID=A0ACB5PT21_9BACT|nr:acyltransferase [Hymenobacter qilianensis]QNP52627.1 acyltransferase [Hymenobacter qilianensis]GGF69356.1 galactoside O-acetyltransferase [Hymenobacter qilianensis]
MSDQSKPIKSAQYDTTLLKGCGEDVFVSANVEIRRPHLVTLGSHVAIDSGVYITTAAQIGDYTHLSPYITVIGGAQSTLIVEDFVTIAAGSRLICGSDQFMGDGFTSVTAPEQYRDTVDFGTIRCARFSGIGTNVVVMPNVTIAEGSVVGACSLVTKDTEPWTIYVGVPARPIKIRPRAKMLEYAKQLGY